MIISHEHRFIFLKTKKTAGTAIEAALSQLCGPECVVTPYREESEQDRKGLAPQNYRIDHPLKPKRPSRPFPTWRGKSTRCPPGT